MTGYYAVLRLPRPLPHTKEVTIQQWYGPLATIQNGGNLDRLTLQVKISPDRMQMENIAFVRIGYLAYYTDGAVRMMLYMYQPSIAPSSLLIDRLCSELSYNRHWHCVRQLFATDHFITARPP